MASVFQNIALSTLAYGDDMVGLTEGLVEFPGVELYIYGIVELWVTKENKVVDGNNTLYATLADAYRKLS